MTRFAQIVGFVALVGALAAPADAEDIDRHYQQSFEVSKGASLHLDHGDGDVEFTTWDQDVVDVEVTYRATVKSGGIGTSSENEFLVEFEQVGDEVRVAERETGRHSVHVGYVMKKVHEYVYEVRVPVWLSVTLRGEDGSVSIRGLAARIDAETQDGGLSLRDVRSPSAYLETQDGDIEIVNCTLADARGRSQDGDVEAVRCAGAFEVRAQDGDVRMELVATEKPELDIRVQDGDVRVSLASPASAEFLLVTEDGDVDVDLAGFETLERAGPATYGAVGAAAGSIRIQTQDGSIMLRDG
jgi:hypothetical protein